MPRSIPHIRHPHDNPVAIVGAGPVGLSLALGLARQGVRSILVEKKGATSSTSKAPGVHVRTREIFRQWGVEDSFLAAGELLETLTMHSVVEGRRPLLTLDYAELADEAERPGLLLLEQSETERLLLEAVRESGLCDVRFHTEVVALDHVAGGARLTVRSDGEARAVTATYVVGCDGASSFVRDALGLPFEGMTYSLRPLLADVRVGDGRDDLPQPRAATGRGGYAFAVRLRPGVWRIVHVPPGRPRQDEPSGDEVHEQVRRLLGRGPVEVEWASRFRIHVRSSPRFRVGHVLLAGDAAHVHSPASGYGMNGGIQDAHNLAWKLAYALRGADDGRLLDSYEVERRAVIVETISGYTDRITRIFIAAPPIVRNAAWLLLRGMMNVARFRRSGLRRFAMLDLDYRESPLLPDSARARGVRLPNPILRAPDGSTLRLYDLLPYAPVLLDVAVEDRPHQEPPPLHPAPAALPAPSVIRIGRDGFDEPSGLLRSLLDGRNGWILVRPDLHVAWARRTTGGWDEAVRHALAWPGVATTDKQDHPGGEQRRIA
jgi:2-polyprenyl-6-methoxyphenol hydroxylase-like FAD-dependent oxidoreductase